MGLELGRFVERRCEELGLTRRQLATLSGVSYPYISQIASGEREPALKAIRKIAPVLEVRPEELAALVAAGEWAATAPSGPRAAIGPSASGAYPSAADMPVGGLLSSDTSTYNKDKVLLSLERRLRDVPPLERIALLNELIAAAVDELSGS